jgi:DNA-binding transcriptional regulator of glucitol operon
MGMKASMLLMLVLTVLAALALGWRENRRPQVAAAQKPGWVTRQKRRANRWVTAAAIAAIGTLALLGGLQWLRFWLQ